MIDRIRIKLRLASQKSYGKNKIRYILETHKNSDILVVVFSGFSTEKEPARFNYIRTLLPLKVNKLFILDDFGYRNRGAYYLVGRTGGEDLQEEICSLISRCRGNRKLITAGSSKGGTAALLYGLRCGADAVIAGAPQYHIGTYLTEPDHRKILEGICGDTSGESVRKLDELLPEEIRRTENRNTRVYIHCSRQEHTFEDHVKDMISDLEEQGFRVYGDLKDGYTDHARVGHYFSGYMKDILRQIMQDSPEH